MPLITVQGKNLYFEMLGQGIPLLFIHCSMANHQIWDRQRTLAKYFQLILVDLPGHGQSESLEGEVTVKRLATLIAELIQTLELQRVILVGYSLGGAISLQLALDHPELLSAIILVGTGAKMGVLPVIFEVIKTNYQEGVELTTGKMGFAKGADPKLIELAKQECLKCSPSIAYSDFAACNAFDVRDQLNEINIPTLIIVGSEDLLAPVKWSLYLTKHILNSSLQIIPQSGHMVILEQPDKFNLTLRKFIDNLEEASMPEE